MKSLNGNSIENFQQRADLLKKDMLDSNLAHPDLIRGCSQQEIAKLEKDNKVIFPISYKVFLENFGRGLGGTIMSDIDTTYEKIFSLTNLLRNEVLIEEGDPILPEKAFVFASRYGEQFMFFDASGLVEEPPILYYMEDDQEFTKVDDTIFDLLERSVEGWKKIRNSKDKS